MKNARQASEVAHFSPVVPRSHLRHVDVRLKEVKFKSFFNDFFCRIEVNFADKKMRCLKVLRIRIIRSFFELWIRDSDTGWGKHPDPG
jgi:hypothetical protein